MKKINPRVVNFLEQLANKKIQDVDYDSDGIITLAFIDGTAIEFEAERLWVRFWYDEFTNSKTMSLSS